MKRSITALLVSLSLPLAASAQPNAARPPTTQEFTFTDQIVQSSLPRPDERVVRPLRTHAGPTLLRLRTHFVPEMLKSVERL